MKRLSFLTLIVLWGCVEDTIVNDEVSPEIRILNPLKSMEVNTTFQLKYAFFDNVGAEATPSSILWQTKDMSIVTVNSQGLVSSLSNGQAEITVTAILEDLTADTTFTFEVNDEPTMLLTNGRTGSIATTSTYALKGDFTVTEAGDNIIIDFTANYQADTRLPGLYVYLTNNPNSPADGYEIGPVTVFSGAHQYTVPNTGLLDFDYLFYYCKPFKVKVGHGDIN
jgi:hypothetical protein